MFHLVSVCHPPNLSTPAETDPWTETTPGGSDTCSTSRGDLKSTSSKGQGQVERQGQEQGQGPRHTSLLGFLRRQQSAGRRVESSELDTLSRLRLLRHVHPSWYRWHG